MKLDKSDCLISWYVGQSLYDSRIIFVEYMIQLIDYNKIKQYECCLFYGKVKSAPGIEQLDTKTNKSRRPQNMKFDNIKKRQALFRTIGA